MRWRGALGKRYTRLDEVEILIDSVPRHEVSTDWAVRVAYPQGIMAALNLSLLRKIFVDLEGGIAWYLGEQVVHQVRDHRTWITPVDPPSQLYSFAELTLEQCTIARRGWEIDQFLDRSMPYEVFVREHLKPPAWRIGAEGAPITYAKFEVPA